MVVLSFDHIVHRINVDGLCERQELETLLDWLNNSKSPIFDGAALNVMQALATKAIIF